LFPKWEGVILYCASSRGQETEVLWEKQKNPLRAWYIEARRADWISPQDIKAAYPTASILRSNRVVFNVKGNTYRLIVAVKYEFQVVYIRFIGTHAEYEKIKAEEV
jgi:mRNA interferase HigB